MSLGTIDRIIDAMRGERYRFSPVRRVYIPKKSGKLRPLGLPTWSDKLVGEVVRLLLEAYYEPMFSDRSHGFRPGRGCHTALREVANTWTGTSWFIEGDLADCFGSFDHDVMLQILAEKTHDNRFLRLVGNMCQAGYLEDWKWGATLSGGPRGGIASPVLSNIYLDRLHKFVETALISEYTRGDQVRTPLLLARLADRALPAPDRQRTEREHMFTFLDQPGVQATNWRAEQALGPAIVNRKNWGGNRTDAGARTQVIAMSVLRTARQQNIDPIKLVAASQRERIPTVSSHLRIPTTRAGPPIAA